MHLLTLIFYSTGNIHLKGVNKNTFNSCDFLLCIRVFVSRRAFAMHNAGVKYTVQIMLYMHIQTHTYTHIKNRAMLFLSSNF